jgi:hypothetical protein
MPEMSANIGDRIIVESEQVGTPAREGEILEVITGEAAERYRVRWADGHETIFLPGGGSAQIIEQTTR